MKELLNRKVSGAFLLGFALLVIVPAQQHRLNVAKHNEASAGNYSIRYALENAALRQENAELKARLEAQ